MVEPRSSMFWQAAVKSGLIGPPALEACWESIPPEKRTEEAIDRRLARQAVNAGHITLWQAQQILAGRYQGLKIDRYVLRDLLGQGGMGRVYLALDTKLNRPVALKILSRERMTNPRALARFRREAKVGAQLQHENLIRIYDEGEAGGVRYLVMEYINGQTVGQMIAEQGRLPFDLAAALTRQVALGLDHLYQKGLLHRDVNPMNIMVDRDGTAKLTDLGLAIDLEDADEVVTRDGATVGTFDYISPEQAKHSRQVDTRSDIYSLGCTTYHMIAGRVPFPVPSLPEKLFAHQSSEPEPLSKLVPGVPEALEAVVRRMMSKRPEDRYPRPAAVARALEPFAASTADALEAYDSATPIPQPPPAPEPPTVISNGAPPARERPGSDPDLVAPAAPPILSPDPAGVSPADPNDFFKLDLGPEPPLSDTLSRERKTARRLPQFRLPEFRPWMGVGAAALLLVALGLAAYFSGWFRPGPRASAAPPLSTNQSGKGSEPTTTVAQVSRADIVVEYSDGTVAEQTDLHEAIQLAVGKPAEVVLRNKEPIRLKVERAINVSGGGLKIRAGEGASPVIALDFEKPAPFLLVSANASLKMTGLTFQVGSALKAPAAVNIIESGGDVELARVRLSACDGPEHGPKVLAAEGRKTRVQGCFFEGFDAPISASLFPDSEVRIEQSMFIRTGDATAAVGWPLAVRPLGANRQGVPKIVFDHCTVVGGGLLRAEGFDDKSPLQVDASKTVAETRALVMWAGPFPGGLRWKGEGNVYEVSGAAWAVKPPAGFDAVEGSPSSLDSWTQGPVAEAEARVMDIGFANDSGAQGHLPAEFTILNIDPPKPGADPALVGPAAKP